MFKHYWEMSEEEKARRRAYKRVARNCDPAVLLARKRKILRGDLLKLLKRHRRNLFLADQKTRVLSQKLQKEERRNLKLLSRSIKMRQKQQTISQVKDFLPNLSTRFTGQAGELLVCFDFVSRGYEAVVTGFPGSPHDILVYVGDRILRVQVKTTTAPICNLRKETRKKGPAYVYAQPVYAFGCGGFAHLFAFVALDLKRVVYVAGSKLNPAAKKKKFGIQSFKEKAETSLDEFLALANTPNSQFMNHES